MTDEQILERAIGKAEKNGFNHDKILSNIKNCSCNGCLIDEGSYYLVIFNHSFAKAFWGDKEHAWEGLGDTDYCKFCGINGTGGTRITGTGYCWQYCLQQMVCESEPLKYIREFLK